MASALGIGSAPVARYPAWDALFVALSILHGGVLLLLPIAPVIAIGQWWNANTISHNFIHRPFFRRPAANRAYAAYLTLVLGFPQTLWRLRHLRHHGEIGRAAPARGSGRAVADARYIAAEVALLVALWTGLAFLATSWLLTAYLPGWAIGLGLCHLQGHYEHARGTTSHYGRVYNFLFFNDGLHVEHHARPGAHWTELARNVRGDGPTSRWPPVLRWLDRLGLEGLERLVLRSRVLQRFVLRAHERAMRRLLPAAGTVRRVVVVGGGLFPRTALILEKLLPDAEIAVLDASVDHLNVARPFLNGRVRLVHRAFEPGSALDADLAVIPLSLSGDRRRIYERPPAPAVLVHDWIFAVHRPSAVVSWLLLKRLNLVRPTSASARRV